jgi:hypothetical protein
MRKLYPNSKLIDELYVYCRYKEGSYCPLRKMVAGFEDCEPRTCWIECRPAMLAEGSLFRQEYTDDMLLDFMVTYALSPEEIQSNLILKESACQYFLNNILSIYAFTVLMLQLDSMPLFINTEDALTEKLVRWRLSHAC